ncbi:hypothetical protein C8Q78DRAFT_502005 [Trametes maxima]|nr:hypothetical protein C8Q78DRAFT_502005 [Trametes maxima]
MAYVCASTLVPHCRASAALASMPPPCETAITTQHDVPGRSRPNGGFYFLLAPDCRPCAGSTRVYANSVTGNRYPSLCRLVDRRLRRPLPWNAGRPPSGRLWRSGVMYARGAGGGWAAHLDCASLQRRVTLGLTLPLSLPSVRFVPTPSSTRRAMATGAPSMRARSYTCGVYGSVLELPPWSLVLRRRSAMPSTHRKQARGAPYRCRRMGVSYGRDLPPSPTGQLVEPSTFDRATSGLRIQLGSGGDGVFWREGAKILGRKIARLRKAGVLLRSSGIRYCWE